VSDLWFILSELHFIRPFWLLLLLPVALVWILVRRRATRSAPDLAGLAPHLRDALTVGAGLKRRLQPIDGVTIVLALAVFGAAGPTWSRQADPFVAQTVPLVVVLKVTPSMTANDVAPTRLERAKQKISDLLVLRAGARTALVAYAGTVHSVVPMTKDPTVMQPYLEGLTPEVMPKEGDDVVAAQDRAKAILASAQTAGAILFVLDALNPADVSNLGRETEEGIALGVLTVLPDSVSDPGIDALNAVKVQVTPDDSDIRALDRSLNADYRRALNETGTQPWDDRGWMMAFPATLLTLLWFRRGWTMRWSLWILAAVLAAASPGPAAAGVADWFLTSDQQGRIAFDNKNYKRAAELFADPMWKARALYKDGQYQESARTYDRLDTPEAAFAKGMAHMRSRGYRDGIAAFEETLGLDPQFPKAAENLQTAQDILEYIETTRAQSDTGEDSGIGADDTVFDNEAERGTETELEAVSDGEQLLTEDQWMGFVDTRTGDFLRQRFAIEAAQQ